MQARTSKHLLQKLDRRACLFGLSVADSVNGKAGQRCHRAMDADLVVGIVRELRKARQSLFDDMPSPKYSGSSSSCPPSLGRRIIVNPRSAQAIISGSSTFSTTSRRRR